MNKLIKLVLVNLLGLFDYNGVLKEVEAGVKGKSETRVVVVAIASIIYGYLVYIVFNMFGNTFPTVKAKVGFLLYRSPSVKFGLYNHSGSVIKENLFTEAK